MRRNGKGRLKGQSSGEGRAGRGVGRAPSRAEDEGVELGGGWRMTGPSAVDGQRRVAVLRRGCPCNSSQSQEWDEMNLL